MEIRRRELPFRRVKRSGPTNLLDERLADIPFKYFRPRKFTAAVRFLPSSLRCVRFSHTKTKNIVLKSVLLLEQFKFVRRDYFVNICCVLYVDELFLQLKLIFEQITIATDACIIFLGHYFLIN